MLQDEMAARIHTHLIDHQAERFAPRARELELLTLRRTHPWPRPSVRRRLQVLLERMRQRYAEREAAELEMLGDPLR